MSNPVNITIKPDKDALATYRKIAETENKTKEFYKALSFAINRTLASMRTQAKREIAQRYVVKSSEVTGAMHMARAMSGSPAGELTLVGPNIPAINFQVAPKTPQPNKRPEVSIAYKTGGGGKVSGAFVAVMKSGHKGVFERHGKARLKIDELYGPSVAGMLEAGDGEASAAVQKTAKETLAKRIEHEMERLLK